MASGVAVLSIVVVLAVGCSSAPSVAPTELSPTPALSPTPGQTAKASPTTAVSGPCAAGSLPEGRITFTVGNGQANGIGVVNADGSGFRMVVEPKVISGQPHGGTEGPSWIGPERIVFDSNRNGGPDDWHLFTVEATGGEPVQVTEGPDGIENYGVPSPDGSLLALSKYPATGDPTEPFGGGGIFVADPDGGNERQVTETPPGGVDEWPDISPDGTRIAFTRGHVGDEGGLFVVNLDGSGLTRIVAGDEEPLRPRWSADGSWIAFHNNGGRFLSESSNVWVVKADGSGLRQLTFATGQGQAFFPTWSPDDEYILFVQNIAGSGTNDLAVIPSAGGTACTLWEGTRSNLAWESDWVSSAPVADIVGTWHRKQTCEELRAAFEAAGLAASHVEWANELCAETQVPTEHSHFFTVAGAFGSHDQNGQQVDDGTYELVGPGELRFPAHATGLGYDGDIVVTYTIAEGIATFDVRVPSGCVRACGDAYFWALSAFASGPWSRAGA